MRHLLSTQGLAVLADLARRRTLLAFDYTQAHLDEVLRVLVEPRTNEAPSPQRGRGSG